MTPERAFYLIAYAAITAGMLLSSAEPIALDGFSPQFDLRFNLHLVALFAGSLLSLAVVFKHTNRWQRCLIGLVLVISITTGFLPISARDALVHHLAVPKMWLNAGQMEQIPWHEWSYYPYLLQLGFTGLLKNQLVWLTPLYHLTFLLITAGLLAAFGEARQRGAGAVAAIVILTLPICQTLAALPLVDLGLLLFSTIGALALSKWLDSPKEWHLPIIAGLAFGLAGLTKFNGLLFLGACGISLLMAFTVQQATPGQKFKALFYLSLISLFTLCPYFIRNFHWTNNPIYPMYKGLFGASTPALTASLPPLAHRMAAYDESVLEVLLLPIRVFVFGKEGDPRLFDGLLSPILLLGFLAIFRREKASLGDKFSSLATLIYLLIAITSAGARVRYLAPIFGILAVNGAPFLLSALRSTPLKQIAATSLIFIHAGYSTFAIYSSQLGAAIKYLSSGQSSADYLTEHFPEYSVISWINGNIPRNEIVYLLYTGNKFYWFDGDARSGGYYSGDEIAQLVKSSHDADSLYRELTIRGIRHLMTNDQRLITGFKGLLTNDELAIWDAFVEKHLKLSFHNMGLSVWTLI